MDSNKNRIPEQVLPGAYYDGEILYGSEMNKIVNILRTGVNANKTDIDNLILDVEKYASITNLGELNFIELNDITQVGIYKFSIPAGLDENGYNYLLFQTFDGDSGVYTQTIYSGNLILMRSGINGNWSYWTPIDLSDINSNKLEINNLNNNLDTVENKVNKNTDDISDLNSSLSVVNDKVDNNISETNKKLDKDTNQEQEVISKVNFLGGIETDFIDSNGLVIGNDTVFGINADKKVSAGEFYEGLESSDDTRLATRKYVADKFNELVGGSPDALDTIYELAAALQNNPDIIEELLIAQNNLQNNKVDKTTKVNGKALSSDINLTKADIGLSNVDNTSDLDKPISTAVQIELDKKANNADLAPILNLENIGFFEKYGNILEETTERFVTVFLQYRLFAELGFQTPIRIGIRHRYGVNKYLILTDSPIQDFEGIVEFYNTSSAGQKNAKITIWEQYEKAVERQNVKQYVKFFRVDREGTAWESIAYESDIEKVEQELLNEISEKVNTSDIIDDLTSTDTNKPLSANQGKVLQDTTAKLAVSNVFTQPQQVPNATQPQHAVNKLQVETMFEMFKRQLPGYNLAMPDLEGKEYLGNGTYVLHRQNGGTLTFNVNTGEYRLFGDLTGNFIYFIGERPVGDCYIQIWKTKEVVFNNGNIVFGNFIGSFYHVSITPTRDYDGKIPEYAPEIQIYTVQVTGEIDVSFKVQLEKGDTATPYTVPGQIPQYNEQYALKQQEAWITPTLLNGWENRGGSYATLQYMKDSLGFVHIKGSVRNGTEQLVITLPAGYRPSEHRRYMAVVDTNEWVFVNVLSSGALNINLTNQPDKVVYFNIIFKAEEGV